jgi:hypothetical protein
MALLLLCGVATGVVGLVGEKPPKAPAVAPEPPAAEDPPAAQAPAAPSATTTEPARTTKVRTRGSPGLKRITYEVTYADGAETGRTKLTEEVVRMPVTKVVAVGTKKPRCDPNYAGACVPIASDVDCAGGSGNGPAYVEGPVTVVGEDIYDLDHDNDGIGCE